jgi:uncharacterized protein YcfL
MKKYLILLCAIFVITACDSRLSSTDLTTQVISSMNTSEFFVSSSIKVDSLIITRDSETTNKYTGILQTSEPNGSFTYSVSITYDGENFTWQVDS